MIEFLKKHFRLIYTFVDITFIIGAYAWVLFVVAEFDKNDFNDWMLSGAAIIKVMSTKV